MAQGTNARSSRRSQLEAVKDTPLDLLNRAAIPVGDEVVHAGRLSLNQMVTLAQIVVDAAAKLPGNRRAVLVDAAKSGTDATDIIAALAVLDQMTVSALFATVIDRDAKWAGDHLDALACLRVIEAVLDHNDMDEVKAVFFRLVSRFGGSRT